MGWVNCAASGTTDHTRPRCASAMMALASARNQCCAVVRAQFEHKPAGSVRPGHAPLVAIARRAVIVAHELDAVDLTRHPLGERAIHGATTGGAAARRSAVRRVLSES